MSSISNSKVVNPLLSSATPQTKDPINNKLKINNFINVEESNTENVDNDTEVNTTKIKSVLNIIEDINPTLVSVREERSSTLVEDYDLTEFESFEETTEGKKSKIMNEDFIEIVSIDTLSAGEGSESDTTKNKIMEDPTQKKETLDINDTKDIINAANHNNIQNVAVYLKHLLNTDIAIYIGTAALALAIFTVFINSENNSVIIIHLIVVRVFFLALPPYWILRSGEKTIFVIRRLKRFFNL